MPESNRLPRNWREVVKKITTLLATLHPAACRTSEEVCNKILDAAITFQHWCCLGQAWSVDPRNQRLILVAQRTRMHITPSFPTIISRNGTYIGGVAETRRPKVFFNIAREQDGIGFEFRQLVLGTEVSSLLAVPIRNTSNPHQVLVVLVFYLTTEPILAPLDILAEISKQVATELETHLRERTYRLATRLACSLVSDDKLRAEAAYTKVANAVRHAVDADETTVYVESWNRKRLDYRAHVTRSTDVFPPSRFRAMIAPKQIREVWESNREILIWPGSLHYTPAELFEDAVIRPSTIMLVPIRNLRGAPVGVIRCVKNTVTNTRPFSYDDVAIAYELGQALGPPLEMLFNATHTETTVSKLCHELRVPVAAFGAAVERMEKEAHDDNYRFRHAYFDDVEIFVDMMNSLLIEVDIIRKGHEGIRLELSRTNMQRDIIAPAIRHVVRVLQKHGLNSTQLRTSGFDSLPTVRVDSKMIYQVVFNLIENAIKYHRGPPEHFRCDIHASVTATDIEITFRDNGLGISEDDRELIFEFQGRGEIARDIAGSGLGLWISQGIARRHGGELELRHSKNPTEFVLRLPRSLETSRRQ